MRFILFLFLFISLLPLYADKKDVTVQLRWLHQFQFAGYYVALHKGYYSDVGLNVTLLEGGPSINPVNMVMSKKAHFGISNSSLVIDYLNGVDVIMLGAIFQHSPNILLTTKEFKSPIDLAVRGKISLMGGDQDVELKAMFLKEGIDLAKVNFIPNKNHLQDLIDNKVSAINAYSSNEPFLMKERNIPYNIIEPRTYGLDFYGDTLFSSKELCKSSPKLVEDFVNATMKGWEYALSHEDEIIELILSQYNTQQKTREHLKYEASTLKKLINPDFVQIGHSNPGRWKHIVETYRMFNLANGDRALEEFYYSPDKKLDLTWFYIYLAISSAALLVLGGISHYIHRINKKLQNSTQRDKILFQNSASAGIVWNESYIITGWNTQAEKLFGWSHEETIGKNFFEFFVASDDVEMVRENMKTILNSNETYIFIEPLANYQK